MQISLIANSGNFLGYIEQGMRHLAGDHIDLIMIGHRNDHIRIIGPGMIQSFRIRGMPDHAIGFELIIHRGDGCGVAVNHGDIVFFLGQVRRQRMPNPAASANNNAHIKIPLLYQRT